VSERPSARGRLNGGQPRARVWWFSVMGLAGLGFGLFADRRPFGDDVFTHPLSVFFILVALALLALRFILARPVPEVIPDRALMLGCALGLAMFLVGNFVTSRGLLMP
jgi:drug/metabolite transporter (DMT)-like permease